MRGEEVDAIRLQSLPQLAVIGHHHQGFVRFGGLDREHEVVVGVDPGRTEVDDQTATTTFPAAGRAIAVPEDFREDAAPIGQASTRLFEPLPLRQRSRQIAPNRHGHVVAIDEDPPTGTEQRPGVLGRARRNVRRKHARTPRGSKVRSAAAALPVGLDRRGSLGQLPFPGIRCRQLAFSVAPDPIMGRTSQFRELGAQRLHLGVAATLLARNGPLQCLCRGATVALRGGEAVAQIGELCLQLGEAGRRGVEPLLQTIALASCLVAFSGPLGKPLLEAIWRIGVRGQFDEMTTPSWSRRSSSWALDSPSMSAMASMSS